MSTDQRRRQQADARTAARRAKGYWRRAGVSRRVRNRRADELHAHLLEAIEHGDDVTDVIGDDLAAFAAEWTRAEHPAIGVEIAAWLVIGAVVLPGLLAVTAPLLPDQTTTGLSVHLLTYAATVFVFLAALQAWRLQRDRMSTQQATAIGIGIVLGYAVALGLVLRVIDGLDRFIEVPAALAWALLAVGLGLQGLFAWYRRRGRR
jgi:hypothetical protein